MRKRIKKKLRKELKSPLIECLGPRKPILSGPGLARRAFDLENTEYVNQFVRFRSEYLGRPVPVEHTGPSPVEWSSSVTPDELRRDLNSLIDTLTQKALITS